MKGMAQTIEGRIYVVRDNIDTDQIIPAQYLNLVPTIREEYERLGSHALSGLPESLYPVRLVAPGKSRSDYVIVIGGRNFGCGSSREHAPIALGAAGIRVIVAESYAPQVAAKASTSARNWSTSLSFTSGSGTRMTSPVVLCS